jgi:hypothetical protein
VGEKCNKEYVWKLYIEMGEKFKMELQEAVWRCNRFDIIYKENSCHSSWDGFS